MLCLSCLGSGTKTTGRLRIRSSFTFFLLQCKQLEELPLCFQMSQFHLKWFWAVISSLAAISPKNAIMTDHKKKKKKKKMQHRSLQGFFRDSNIKPLVSLWQNLYSPAFIILFCICLNILTSHFTSQSGINLSIYTTDFFHYAVLYT